MKNDCEANGKGSTRPYDTLSESSLTEQKPIVEKTEETSCNARTICYACPFVLLGILLFLGIPLVQIIVGTLYKNECPINPLIPIYLIVTGVVTLTLLPTIILGVTFTCNPFTL